MRPTDFRPIFLQCAAEVLETMFFVSVDAEIDSETQGEMLTAELSFQAGLQGWFGVSVCSHTARTLAANFLVVELPTDEQAEEVLCELTNMLCGSVLSRLETKTRLELQPAEIRGLDTASRNLEDRIGY